MLFYTCVFLKRHFSADDKDIQNVLESGIKLNYVPPTYMEIGNGFDYARNHTNFFYLFYKHRSILEHKCN